MNCAKHSSSGDYRFVREIDRMLVAFEARRDDAIELMMGHDLPNLRAFGTAARNLDIRARLLAYRAPNRQYSIVPAFQQDVYEPDGGVPTFSVTVWQLRAEDHGHYGTDRGDVDNGGNMVSCMRRRRRRHCTARCANRLLERIAGI